MQAVPVPIRPGMNEGTDPRLLPVGTPRLVQNIRYRQLERAEKRPGTVGIGATGLPATAGAAAAWATEWNGLPVACVEVPSGTQSFRNVYVRDATQRWNKIGRTSPVVAERRIGVSMDDDGTVRASSCVAIDGVVYVAWADTGNVVYLAALDPGGTMLRVTSLSSAFFPRLIYANSILYLIYTDGGTALSMRTVTPSTLAFSAATALYTLGFPVSPQAYDAAPLEGATSWLLAYTEDATHIRVRVMSATTSLFNTTIVTTSAADLVSIAGAGTAVISGGKVVVAYVDGTAAEVCTFTSTLGSPSNVTLHTATGNEDFTTQSGVVRTGTNEWHVVFCGTDFESPPTVTTWFIRHGRVDNAGALIGSMRKGRRFLPCSKPFVTGADGTRKVSIVAHDALTGGNSRQSAHHIIDLEPGSGSFSGGGLQFGAISYEHQPRSNSTIRLHNPEVAVLGSGLLFCPILWEEPNGIFGLDALVFRSATTTDGVTLAGRTTREVSGALCVSGGALLEICGADLSDFHYVTENGYANDPYGAGDVSAGGALTSGETYFYRFVYNWLDSNGTRIHRSAPSLPVTVSPAAGNLTAALKIAEVGCTGRFSSVADVVVEAYRSWDGGPFFYCTSSTGFSSGFADITDAASDATVSASRTLYTDSGVLDNEPPSGARLFWEGNGRAFAVGWKERVVEVSKLMIPTAPIEFCDDNAFRIFHQERLEAGACMDGAVVTWSRRSIFVTTGDGPDDQGNGAYPEPRRLPAAVGADSPHVVEVPQGVLFKGAGTIWLLPRGFGTPQPVGDAIEETLAAFPYLRSAVRCSNGDDDCTHFTLAANDTLSAETKVAVWDNRLGAWSLDDIAGEVGAAGAVNGVFTWLLPTWDSGADVPARQFSSASFQDLAANNATATWIEWRVGFGDWCPFGPLGWGTVRMATLLGENAGACTLNIVVTVDGAAQGTWSYPRSTGRFYLDHQLERRKATSYRFDLYDSETVGQGKTAGFVLNAIAFEAQAEEGLRRNAERV